MDAPRQSTPTPEGDGFLRNIKNLVHRKDKSPGTQPGRVDVHVSVVDGTPVTAADEVQDDAPPESRSHEDAEVIDNYQDPWVMAEKKLEEDNPKIHAKLQELKQTLPKNLAESISSAEHVAQMLKSDLTKVEKKLSPKASMCRRFCLSAATQIIALKEVAMTGARFDPHRAAPGAVAGLTFVLAVKLPPLPTTVGP